MTTIDGDEVQSVTIDGDEVQEITVDGDVVYQAITGPSHDGWSVDSTTDTTADCTISVSDMGSESEWHYWPAYRESGSSSWNYDTTNSPASVTSIGDYTVTLTGLSPETEYDFRGELWDTSDSTKYDETVIITTSTDPSETYVDDFSHQDMTEYYWDSSDTAASTEYFTTTTSWGDKSSTSMEVTTSSTTQTRSFPESNSWYDSTEQPSTLPYYPTPGDTIHVRFQPTVSNDGSYNGNTQQPRFMWGCDGIDSYQSVQIAFQLSGAPMHLYDGATSNIIETQEISPVSAGDTLEWVISWDTNGTSVTVDCLNITDGGTNMGTASASFTEHNGDGIGWWFDDEQTDKCTMDAVWVE